jgi:hypothetical protein
MRKIGIVFLMMLVGGLQPGAHAQYMSVSNEINLNRDTYYELLGKYGKDILLLEESPSALTLKRLDEAMNFSGNTPIHLGDFRSRVIGYIPTRKHFDVVFASYRKDSILLLQHKYDGKGSLLFKNRIASVPKTAVLPKFDMVVSENKEFAALYKANSRSFVDLYGWNVSTGDSLYTRSLNLADLPLDFTSVPLQMDNQGHIYFFFESTVPTGRNLRKISFVKFNPFTGRFSDLDVYLSDIFLNDFKLVIDNQNQTLNALGLVTTKRYGANVGTIAISMPLSFEEDPKVSVHTFGPKLLSDYHGEKNPNATVIPNLQIKDVILRQDGGMLAILEDNKEFARRNFVGRRDMYGMGPASFSVDYFYEDIIALAFKPSTVLHWEKVLPKRQYSYDDDALFSSFFLVKTPKSVRLLYNDEIRSESTVSEYVIEGNGGIQRKALVSTANQNLKLQLRSSLQVTANEIIVPSIRGRKLSFVRIIYPPEQIK